MTTLAGLAGWAEFRIVTSPKIHRKTQSLGFGAEQDFRESAAQADVQLPHCFTDKN